MGLVFEWDWRKAAQNLKKHKVHFDEAVTVFSDPEELMIFDPDHGEDEERWISIGLSAQERLLVVCYTENDLIIRIISARQTEMAEMLAYQRS